MIDYKDIANRLNRSKHTLNDVLLAIQVQNAHSGADMLKHTHAQTQLRYRVTSYQYSQSVQLCTCCVGHFCVEKTKRKNTID